MFLYTFSMTSTAATPSAWSGITGLIVPLALMFGLMYLLMIRPQKKKEKALKEQLNAMVVGDKCLTIGGIVGKVVNIKDDEVTIQTSVANTLITVRKSAISNIFKPISED
ncbi:MAG: preprotein translocase subunit YajC [Saccharofermentanales bacterium]